MSRATHVAEKPAEATAAPRTQYSATPDSGPVAVPADLAVGESGPYTIAVSTEKDPRIRVETQELLERAREIRPRLRAAQAQTEVDGHYPLDVHEFFLAHGFYRMLLPLRYGGLELGVSAFYLVISEVARGCPSTAWCLSLSAGHSLTVGSYWPERAQSEIFAGGYMIAPASGGGRNLTVLPVEGGYRISGTWRYASGAPYSTHFMPTAAVPARQPGGPTRRCWMVLPREDYTILDDWGRVIGMRGSGSNSITVDDVFVPEHLVVEETWTDDLSGDTVGSALHGNPLYAGTFVAFAEGEVAATSVGLGYAALDEYERIIQTSKAPWAGGFRADHDDWLRTLGLATGYVDAAAAIQTQSGRLYEEYAARSVAGVEPFDKPRSWRLSNSYFVVEQLVWDAVELLIRTAGSSVSADGQPLQRYFRDILTTRTRTDQFDFVAAGAMSMQLDSRRRRR